MPPKPSPGLGSTLAEIRNPCALAVVILVSNAAEALSISKSLGSMGRCTTITFETDESLDGSRQISRMLVEPRLRRAIR